METADLHGLGKLTFESFLFTLPKKARLGLQMLTLGQQNPAQNLTPRYGTQFWISGKFASVTLHSLMSFFL